MPTPGTLLWIDFAGYVGHEQQKERPVVVLRDTGPSLVVIPLTSALKKGLPTHVPVGRHDLGTGEADGTAICEHFASVDPSRVLRELPTRLDAATLSNVRRGAAVSLGLVAGFDHASPAPRRGDIVEVDWMGSVGAEPSGRSLAVVVQNNTGNHFAPTTICVPVAAAGRGGLEQALALAAPLGPQIAILDATRVVDKRLRNLQVRGALDSREIGALDASLQAMLS